jgi:hypothetical protein
MEETGLKESLHISARTNRQVLHLSQPVHREGKGVEEVDRKMEEDIPNSRQICGRGPHTPFVETESSLQSNQEGGLNMGAWISTRRGHAAIGEYYTKFIPSPQKV